MVQEETIVSLLKEYFGFETFKALQEDIIQHLLQGHNALVIMPTGGGKSLCYQLPALAMKGCALVISPLIALMKDQVDGLNVNGIPAACVNSSLTTEAQEQTLAEVARGTYKMLYLAPESLDLFFRYLPHFTPSLIAIDEAHCISSWGHDFRPSYTQLDYLKKRFPKTPMVALTATADKATREDILRALGIPDARIFLSSFNRPNLSLEVRPGQEKFKQILTFLKSRKNESGIIYCLSRKSTEEISAKLNLQGYTSAAYHAGLTARERDKIQEDFSNDITPVICATIAFGMGIDKSNVRWVIHYNLPKNIEGYYQEIGRAGRDGLPSETLLFYSYADLIQLRKFAEDSVNRDVQLAKLERMLQFAESLNCRRKVLLSYFGEHPEDDCGNCDRCKYPPKYFDGTVIAQKALSCIARLGQRESLPMIIDVLRGAQKSDVFDKQYHRIKTYGAGKDISWRDWQQYLIQLMNLGLVELAFHDHNALRLTPLSSSVLKGEKKVSLAHVASTEKTKGKTSKIQVRSVVNNNLFERLRLLRLEISKKEGIPAYLIFNDATLKEMAAERPMNEEAFIRIDGVGRKKLQEYGYRFIKEITAFSEDR